MAKREQPSPIEREFMEVVRAKLLADADAGVGNGLDGAANARLMAMRLFPDEMDGATTPLARRKERLRTYEPLPHDSETLTQKGGAFLDAIGFDENNRPAGTVINCTNRQGILEVHCSIPSVDCYNDVTFTVSQKGMQFAATLGDFFRATGALQFFRDPERLSELDDAQVHITDYMEEKAGQFSEDMRILHEYEVGDNADGEYPTSVEAFNLLDVIARYCSSARVSVAEPLVAVAISTKEQSPRRSRPAIRHEFVVTEGVAHGYRSLGELYDQAKDAAQKYEQVMALACLQYAMLGQMPEGFETAFELNPNDVFTDGQGNFRVVDFAAPEDSEDDDDDDEDAVHA